MTAYMFALMLTMTYGAPINLGVYQDFKRCVLARDGIRAAAPHMDNGLYFKSVECEMKKYADETYE